MLSIREEQEYYAYLRPLMHRFGAGHGRNQPQVGADYESGDYVAEDERLLESPGYYGEDTGRYQDNCKFGYQVEFIGHPETYPLYWRRASASTSMAFLSRGTSST